MELISYATREKKANDLSYDPYQMEKLRESWQI